MKKANKKKLMDALNAMEQEGNLPLFGNDVDEIELHSPVEINGADMDMIKTVNVAIVIGNVITTLHMAKKTVADAFKGNATIHDPVMGHLEMALTDTLAAQANAMREITKRANAYHRANKTRKTAPQKYEKTYSKVKTVR